MPESIGREGAGIRVFDCEPGQAMRPKLSIDDVQKLLADPSPDSRAKTATKISGTYRSEDLSPEERSIAEDILKCMLNDAEIRVREALSSNLKDYPGLSRDIARSLASDVESVSLPVIRLSSVLTDDDLIEIIRTQGTEKQVAVAQRERVSETVSDALVETHNEDVVSALVSNEGAEITEGAMQKVLDDFGDNDRINQPLARRSALPVGVAERLVTLVSDSLKDHLLANHDLPNELATDLILQSRERVTLGLLSPDSDADDVQVLVSQLNATGRLTPTILLRAVCMGDLDFFEVGIAVLARVPLGSARLLIHDEGPLGLRAITERAGLPEELYPAFRVAIDVLHENEYDGGAHDRERFRRRMIERILTYVEDPTSEIGTETAEYLLAKLSQIDPSIIGDLSAADLTDGAAAG